MATGRFVEPAHLSIQVPAGAGDAPSLREARRKAEREALLDALLKTRGNTSKAAKHLGVSRPTFHGMLEKYEVNARDFR